MHTGSDKSRYLPHHRPAGRLRELVLKVLQRLAVQPRGQRRHARRIALFEDGDDRSIDVQDLGQPADQVVKQGGAVRARDGQGGGSSARKDVVGPATFHDFRRQDSIHGRSV